MIAGLPIDRGLLTAEWASLPSLGGERFDVAEAYFEGCLKFYPGLDRRGQGAFFIGGVSYYAAALLASYDLRGKPLPDLARFAARINDAADGLTYRLDDDVPAASGGVAEVLEASLLPLVLRLRAETRIGERAQWRLVADGVASAFQEVGQELGCGALARQRALAAVARGRMANPQTGYHRLEVEGEERHYLKRGGCCRWYTADTGEYCATCVVRKPVEQVVELRKAVLG